ncbi:MAG: methylated-DNA--[protein]-cysteine S-methyltransferase [Armatimonadota bacterium]
MRGEVRFVVDTPAGPARCRVDSDGRLTELLLGDADAPGTFHEFPGDERVAAVRAALERWFGGADDPGIALAPDGTEFRQRVWERLRRIPRGTVATYGEIAADLGVPGAARAVGAACGANPIHLFVPCHRVVGARGLTGYAAGLGRKAWLLRHEGVPVPEPDAPVRAGGSG